jgi:hypothetical protein
VPNVLNMMARTAIVILSLTAMGTAHARAINYNCHYVHPGYAGPVPSPNARDGGPGLQSAVRVTTVAIGGAVTAGQLNPVVAIDSAVTDDERLSD